MILDVGIVELEPFIESFAGKIELHPFQVRHALGVDHDLDAVAFEQLVFGLDLIGIFQLVGKTGAA